MQDISQKALFKDLTSQVECHRRLLFFLSAYSESAESGNRTFPHTPSDSILNENSPTPTIRNLTKRDHSNERFKLPSLLSVLWNYPCKYNILFKFSRSIKYILSNFTWFQPNSDPIEIRIVTQQVQRFISAQIFFQYFTMWLLNAWRLPFLLPSKCLDRKYVPSWRIIQLRGRSH